MFWSWKLFQVDRSYLHHWGYVKLFEELSRLFRFYLCFWSILGDNLSETGSHLDLLLEITVLEESEKNIPNVIIRLPVHNLIPITVPDLDFLYFWWRILDAFLKFKKILMIFLSHGIVTNRIHNHFQNSQGFSALQQCLRMPFKHRIHPAKVQLSLGHTHMNRNKLQLPGLIIKLWLLHHFLNLCQLFLRLLQVLERLWRLFFCVIQTGNIVK